MTATVASRLKQFREMLDLTQAELAQVLGVSLRSYHHYENGERSLSSESLIAFTSRFGIDYNWMFVGDEPPDDPNLVQFLQSLDQACKDWASTLSEGDRRAIVAKWYEGRHRVRPQLRDDPEFWIRLASPEPLNSLPPGWARPCKNATP